MKTSQGWFFFTVFIISALVTGCSAEGDAAAGAVQAYIQALVDQDSERLATLSCAGWEADARTDLESFTAVSVTLQDASCQETGTDEETHLVTCTGKIMANYGNEVQEIDLSERTYQAVYEGGEWRMCGYR